LTFFIACSNSLLVAPDIPVAAGFIIAVFAGATLIRQSPTV